MTELGDGAKASSFASELKAALLGGYLLILIGTAAGLLLAVIFSWILPRDYIATAVVGPRVNTASQIPEGVQALASSLGYQGAGAEGHFSQFLQMTKSVSLAHELMRRTDVARQQFANQWNADDKTWHAPTGAIASLRDMMHAVFNVPDWHAPTDYDLADQLNRNLRVDPVIGTTFQRLTFHDKTAGHARDTLNFIITNSDALLRDRAQARTREQINFLQARLQDVSVVSYRASLIELIADQERQLMVTNTNQPYTLDVLDPPSTSGQPNILGMILRILIGMGAGFLASFAFCYYRTVTKPSR